MKPVPVIAAHVAAKLPDDLLPRNFGYRLQRQQAWDSMRREKIMIEEVGVQFIRESAVVDATAVRFS
jgi:hypothetical protein